MNAAQAAVVSKVALVLRLLVHSRVENCPSHYCLSALMLEVEYVSVRLMA